MTTDELIQRIYDYGIGYDDSISEIAVPLIVALFAFAFPLLFQVMSHIESKYASENISKMFEKTMTYKWLWASTYISIGYVVVFVILALSLKDRDRQVLMCFSNWTSIAVAAAYSLVIIAFVRMCVRFNSPNTLLKMIGEQYRVELRYEEIQLAVMKVKHFQDKVQFWRSKGWKSFKDFSFRWTKVFGHYKSSEDYGKRLEDICKYAIDMRNKNLFKSVMEEIVKITSDEKQVGIISSSFSYSEFEKGSVLPKTQQFYEHLFEYVSLLESKSYFENELVRRRLASFNQNLFPQVKEIVSFVHDVILAVEAGHYEVYEKYIDESDFKYLFIQNLPVTAYVMGGEVNDQKSTEKKRHEFWIDMVDIHFLMNAYLFSRGHHKVLTTVRTAKYFQHGHLYPLTPNEVLAVYARTTQKISIDGGYFNHWQLQDFFGKMPEERDFLEKYAIALMLLCSGTYGMEEMYISEMVKSTLNEKYEKLLRVAKCIVQDRELTSKYPQLTESAFANLFIACIQSYEVGRIIDKSHDKEQDTGFWLPFIKGICSWKCDKNKKNKGKLVDIFNCKVPDDRRSLFERDLKLVFCNTGWMPRGLKEDERKGELCRVDLQNLYILMNKRYIYHYNHNNSFHLSRHFEMVFEQRCAYLFYTAVNKMQLKNIKVRVADFETFYNRYTNGNKEDYIIIDTDCTLSVGIDVNREGDGYKHVFLDSSEYLKDVSLTESFRNSLIVMKKEDFPSLFSKGEDTKPKILLEDASNKKEGIAAMGVTIIPNLELRYYENTKVIKVTLIK